MPAIPSHSTATTDAAWDGPGNVARLSNDAGASVYRRAFSWVDPQGDPDAKGSYKFPHHQVGSDGTPGAANVRGAIAVMAVLNGARGGASIPPGDRSAVAAHMARHMRDAGMEPTPLRFAPENEGEEFMADIERRYTPSVVEVRAVGERRKIGGYAAVFSKLSRPLGGFVEVVDPNFFNNSRAGNWPDVIARFNHDNNMMLGTTGSGTLHLEIDDTGLLYEVDPPQARADILELVTRGDIRKSSFAFTIEKGGDEWSITDQGYPMRTLKSGKLIDVAPVTSPAYMDTTAGIRSLAECVGVDFEEVRMASEANDLLRYLQKTSKGIVKPKKRGLFGPAALAQLQTKRDPLGD